MNLKQLEVFLHVAELGSFTRAAEFLRIAQPALSRQVRALEVELRQHLLTRNGRGVAPTAAGRRLLAHARGILHQVERAREDLAEMRGAPVGHVALGLPPTVGRVLTVALVDAFRARYPKATLGIREGLTVNIAEWLAAGRVDVGLLYNPAPAPALEVSPLAAEALYLIGPAAARAARGRTGAPVPLKDLAAHRLILPSRPNSMRMLIESRLAEIGARIDVALEVDAIQSILDLVARGHGHAVLSLNAIGSDAERTRLAPRLIVKPRLITRLAIATSAQRPVTPMASALVELLREIGPAALERDGG
jgi:LysR family nitrogen assimilation transcriptional regulator